MFESILYREVSKFPLLFEIILRLHQVQMRGDLVLYVILVAGTRIVEAEIDALSGGGNLGGIIRGLNPLQFFLLYKGAVARSAKLKPCIRTWWVDILNSISAKYWFEHKGGNLLWDTPPSTA